MVSPTSWLRRWAGSGGNGAAPVSPQWVGGGVVGPSVSHRPRVFHSPSWHCSVRGWPGGGQASAAELR